MELEIKVSVNVDDKDNNICSKHCYFFDREGECFLYSTALCKNEKGMFKRCEDCITDAILIKEN